MSEYIHLKILRNGKFCGAWADVIEALGILLSESPHTVSLGKVVTETALILRDSIKGKSGFFWKVGRKVVVVTREDVAPGVADAIYNSCKERTLDAR